MAESASSKSSSLLSSNSIMTIVTVVGALVLVSHKLSSERPATPLSEGTQPLGRQNIESRLWEDPFAAWDKLTEDEKTKRTSEGLTSLVETITATIANADSPTCLIVAVMVSGQPYAEDKESRIRARYAVGAALGTGGYKPVVSDHIGLVALPWPGSKELEVWKQNTNAQLGLNWQPDSANSDYCEARHIKEFRLRVPFEAYEPREFFPRDEYGTNSSARRRYGRVVLVWLDEEYFDEDTVLRLALFRAELQRLRGLGANEWAIIGPRSSSTLKELLANSQELSKPSGSLGANVKDTLKSTRLALATPTAMDEVLLGDANDLVATNFSHPREAVSRALTDAGLFASVANFACTDKQLARETLRELKSRGITPKSNPDQHVVLISEWDTFVSRLAGLAFAAELGTTNEESADSPAFIKSVRNGERVWPPNLHRFVYLQGLDGERAETEKERGQSSKGEADHRRPSSFEEVTKWVPDANKAEGPAQFDYLARLGDVLRELDGNLQRSTGHGIAAVGIVGSDVYDTLLILQALRMQLPDAVFFTTDLDARFWNPDELSWSRNLLVVSGYGLRLNHNLQAGVAPFRDSLQCAEFLATLWSIQNEKVPALSEVPPRRFEIGRHGPIDLSTDSTNTALIHPPARVPHAFPAFWMVIASVTLLVPALILWKSFRRLVWLSPEYCCEPLEISEEDIGGKEGAEKIASQLKSIKWNSDPLALWLLAGMPKDGELRHLVTRCNLLVFMPALEDNTPAAPSLREQLSQTVKGTNLLRPQMSQHLLNSLKILCDDGELLHRNKYNNRRAVNELLQELSGHALCPEDAAAHAREMAIVTYERRKQRPLFFWLAVLLVGLPLAAGIRLAWIDTYGSSDGEPFNLAGTSAWPTEFIRFGVLAFSIIIIASTQRKLTQTGLDVARSYRLNLNFTVRRWARKWIFWPREPDRAGREDVSDLWTRFYRARHWFPRLIRVTSCVLLYLGFLMALFQMGGMPSSPIRGRALLLLDKPLLICTVLSFFFVTFWMIDAAGMCALFIDQLSDSRTHYHEATLKHFKEQQQIDDDSLVEGWIDLQLIADLTEAIRRLVYWPFVALLLMLLARNRWWDNFSWPWPLITSYAINMVLAAMSYLILQRAAENARKKIVEQLKCKLNEKRRQAEPSAPKFESEQAKTLLDEINNLQRGAFAGISQNPLLGGLLLNSSGLVLVELFAQLYLK